MSILVSIASSHDNPDRCTVAFVVAVAAVASGQDTTVFLSADGAWVGKQGEAEKINEEGFAPLAENWWPASSRPAGRFSCARPAPRSAASPRRISSPGPSPLAVPRSRLCLPPEPPRSAIETRRDLAAHPEGTSWPISSAPHSACRTLGACPSWPRSRRDRRYTPRRRFHGLLQWAALAAHPPNARYRARRRTARADRGRIGAPGPGRLVAAGRS